MQDEAQPLYVRHGRVDRQTHRHSLRGPVWPEWIGFLAAGTAMQYLARRSEPSHERGAWQLRDLTDDSQAEPVQSGPHLRVAAQHGCGERRQKGRLVA